MEKLGVSQKYLQYRIVSKNGIAHDVLIDACDEYLFKIYNWQVLRTGPTKEYVKTRLNGKTKALHQIIMMPPKGFVVDHINRNTFDNRRENLRICTYSENNQNSLKQHNKITSSKYKGVHKIRKNWRALVMRNFIVGTFSSEIEAALAYDACVKIAYGEYAATNESMYGKFYENEHYSFLSLTSQRGAQSSKDYVENRIADAVKKMSNSKVKLCYKVGEINK